MIYISNSIENKVSIDIGRPSFYNESDRKSWFKFFWAVEKSSIEINVNSLYFAIKEYFLEEQGYGGGGMKFMFWFNNEEDKNSFIEECERNIPEFNWKDLK